MRPKLELVGKRFGRLVVLAKNPISTSSNNSRWDCQCDCGNISTVVGSKLINNHTSSCGCFHYEQLTQSCVTHGMSSTPEYNIWSGIKTRCFAENSEAYDRYGGRGITMCERWKDSFENFYADMGPRPSQDYSIERENNNKGYEPGNCIWATPTDQANNRRSNVYYEYNGVRKTIAEWAREYNMTYATLSKRLNRGMDFHTAVTTPPRSY